MKKVFEWYLESSEGRQMTQTFKLAEKFEDNGDKFKDIFKIAKDYLNYDSQLDEDAFISILYDRCCTVNDFFALNESMETQPDFYEKFTKEYELFIWKEVQQDGESILVPERAWCKSTDYRRKASNIAEISMAMYYFFNEWVFYPILFRSHFSEFVGRCEVLGIELPEIPPQKDKFERCMLYYQINEAIESFRKNESDGGRELTKEEVCALLYGYAGTILKENTGNIEKVELPSPTRIWFAGASKEDYATALKQDTSIWQCNETTRRGDIVVLYVRTPYSYIHSVWRAIKDADFNPFDYYCDRIEVGHRIEVPHVTNKELKEDSYTSQMPIVKKNLQGLDGVELSIEDYKNFQRLFAAKGFDNNVLPQIERPELNLDVEIVHEKDVEEHILIPLLKELGYSDVNGEDWERQVLIKLGRNEKYIPDFVFFPQRLSSRQVKAPFMIEAKLDFKSVRQFRKDFDQAVSYVRPLEATYLGICDKEQIRIYERGHNGFFTEDTLRFHDYWGNLQKPEVFNSLKKLIGRDVISKLK